MKASSSRLVASAALFPACIVAFLLAGCGATVSLKSNADKEGARQANIKSIFVFYQGVEKTEKLMAFMGVHLDSILTMNGYRTMVYEEKPLSLDNTASYKEKIAAFKPEAVLYIAFKGGSTQNGNLIEARFDGVLLDSALEKKLWRADIKMSIVGYASMMWETYGRDLGNNILRRMDQDSVIHLKTKIPEPQQYNRSSSYP